MKNPTAQEEGNRKKCLCCLRINILKTPKLVNRLSAYKHSQNRGTFAANVVCVKIFRMFTSPKIKFFKQKQTSLESQF